MGFCPENCIDWTLIGNPSAGCDLTAFRKRTLSRLAFMACNIAIPTPIDATGMDPLFASGDIVLSSPLRNVVVNDPETEDLIIHDCAPAQKFVNRRSITFEDTIAITVPAQTGPPPVPANLFYDYDFWKDKKEKRLLLRYGLVFCDGSFIFARDADGNLLEAWFDIFLSYQKLANNGGTLEFKKGTIDFQADPLDFAIPDFNINDLAGGPY